MKKIEKNCSNDYVQSYLVTLLFFVICIVISFRIEDRISDYSFINYTTFLTYSMYVLNIGSVVLLLLLIKLAILIEKNR